MYSVVLLAVLTTAPTTQSWHRSRCHGCYATRGYVGASCFYSYGCYGRFGHGCHGCHGGNVGYGGYGGSGCYGCYGCYGDRGGYTSGSYGYAVSQCYGCHGCQACHGCHGGSGCTGCSMTHQAHTEPAPPSGTPEKGPAIKPGRNYQEAPLPPVPKVKQSEEQARARVVVDLPADAKLYVDGQLMSTTSARRIFQTPILEPSQLYYYELKAEVIRDGQTITANQRVLLRPGQAAAASFADLGVRREATAQAGQQ